MGLLDRLRERLARPVDRAQAADQTTPAGGSDDAFVHAPDADIDQVPLPKRVGFDGRELPQSGSQSGSFPAGGLGAGGAGGGGA